MTKIVLRLMLLLGLVLGLAATIGAPAQAQEAESGLGLDSGAKHG